MTDPAEAERPAAALRAYLSHWQDGACILDALLEGAVIVKAHPEGSNALNALLPIAQERAEAIYNALDIMSLPDLESARHHEPSRSGKGAAVTIPGSYSQAYNDTEFVLDRIKGMAIALEDRLFDSDDLNKGDERNSCALHAIAESLTLAALEALELHAAEFAAVRAGPASPAPHLG